MTTKIYDEDVLREMGGGLLPHEMGEGIIQEYFNKLFGIFEKSLVEEIRVIDSDIDYDFITQQVESNIAALKEQIIPEFNLFMLVMVCSIVDGNPISGVLRSAVNQLNTQLLKMYKPSNLTTSALGFCIARMIDNSAKLGPVASIPPQNVSASLPNNVLIFKSKGASS